MEVHKHPHHVMHKKKWLEYLLEFTMLFMAVFLGFLAENIREHRVEKERGKEYVRSIINDLKADTTLLGRNIINIEARLKSQKAVIDSFYLIEKGYNKTFFENLNSFKGFPDFIYSDATIQQLKYSGGFRLIKKQAIVDSIMTYDSEVRRSMINASDLGKNLINLHNYSDQWLMAVIACRSDSSAKARQSVGSTKLEVVAYSWDSWNTVGHIAVSFVKRQFVLECSLCYLHDCCSASLRYFFASS